MRYSRHIFGIVFITLAFTIPRAVSASSTIGVIDATNKYARVCTNTACTSYTRINFLTTNGTTVKITSSVVTGQAWSETWGWIDFHPTNGGVSNTTAGILSGYAWGQNLGWINFNPTNGGVSINTSDGKFSGWAWAQNAGWIHFDCTLTEACVQTDWRPTTASSGGSGSSGSGGGTGIITPPPACTNVTCTPPPPPPDKCKGDSCTIKPPPDCGPECVVEPPDDCKDASCVTPPDDGGGGDTTGDEGPAGDAGDTGSTGDTGSGPDSSGGSAVSGGMGGGTVLIPSISSWFPSGTVLNTISTGLTNFLVNPTANAVVKVISVTAAATGLLVALGSALAVNPFSLPELILLPLRLWSLLLSALGLKRKPWGVVYDSITKQPLDPVYVVLSTMAGEEVATTITDMDGRYGFLVKPGDYKITANKANYRYPSLTLFGRENDELYHNLYFGEPIHISYEHEVITKSLPMDPLQFNWNEFEKSEKHLTKYFSKRLRLWYEISTVLFYAGFALGAVVFLAHPTILNAIIAAAYVGIAILRSFGIPAHALGVVSRKGSDHPEAFAIIRLFSVATRTEIAHRVTDANGRYYCLVQDGNYYATVERKNSDGTYGVVYTSEPMTVKKGYFAKSFEI